MVFAVIRIRGSINVNPDIKHTLKLLRLNKVNHCVLVEENDITKGMLQVIKDYVTWGEIEKEYLLKLIKTRGKIIGNKILTNNHLKSSTSIDSIEKLSESIYKNKFNYKDIPDIKPLFRLNPPKKGYNGVKKSFKNKGSLGYRGKEINKLIDKMI